ncbi:putative Ig domain-containing protein [Luteimicrobium sp. NPDC057192]|uniref:putative Ig domain-containing protein n=1 Tax=Luteimicrobium sp. NPDC057192 TaxID=3346042 RepID=UPI00362A669B
MRFRRFGRALVALGTAAALTGVGGAVGATTVATADAAAPVPAVASTNVTADGGWRTSWTQSQQRVSGLSADTFKNRSMRILTRLTQGGPSVRLRLQNQFGTKPLTVDTTTVGLSAGGATVRPGTLRTVTFGGSSTVTIPAGGQVWSDPVELATKAQDDLDVSFYFKEASVLVLHDLAGRTNYFSAEGGGDTTADTSGAGFPDMHGWTYLVSAVDVENPALAGTVVAYGSSVVDGVGGDNCGAGCPKPDPYQRWTDTLARRVVSELPADQQLAVVNEGISGTTASAACQAGGIDGVSRLDRDVLALHGVSAVLYYYGTNDLADGCSADTILAAYHETFSRLHAAGIKVYVTPITPRPGYTATQNAFRATVNAFVRAGGNCSGTCDGVLDFDAVLKDPANPNAINPAYDNGDGIHANIAGQTAIADSIPLATLTASSAPRLTSGAPDDARTGRAYRATFSATGFPAPTFAVSDGTLPAGLELDPATGVLAGTPTSSGRSTFTVRASNAVGHDDRTVALRVVRAPVLTSGAPRPGVVGAAYAFRFRAAGFPAPRFAVTAGALPKGLSLDRGTGKVRGTPTTAGRSDVTITARNGVGTPVRARYTITVGEAASAVTVASGPQQVVPHAQVPLDVLVFASGTAATGRVRVTEGHALLAAGTVDPDGDVPGVARARVVVPTGMLDRGVHELTVTYLGDDDVAGSTATWSVTVGK